MWNEFGSPTNPIWIKQKLVSGGSLIEYFWGLRTDPDGNHGHAVFSVGSQIYNRPVSGVDVEFLSQCRLIARKSENIW